MDPDIDIENCTWDKLQFTWILTILSDESLTGMITKKWTFLLLVPWSSWNTSPKKVSFEPSPCYLSSDR